MERFLQNLWIPGTSCYNFISGSHQNTEVLLLRSGMISTKHSISWSRWSLGPSLHGWPQELTIVVSKSLLFGAHLANIDPHTDDFSCLHAYGARGLPVPSCSCVEGRNWSVLDTLAPGTGLPVVHSAGMLVTAAHLLQSTAVWTLNSTYKNRQYEQVRYGANRSPAILCSLELTTSMIPATY